MSPVVLGIDLATATARITAVDADTGAVLADRSGALPTPWGAAGVREQEPVYAGVTLALLRGITTELGTRARDIVALSITGTSGTVVPTDTTGHPTGTALLYNDARGSEQMQRLGDAGLGIRPSAALARAAWLHHTRPAERYLFTPDVVLARLAGRILPTDTSHALKSGIDPVTAEWDAAALESLDLPVTALPELVAPGRVVGTVTDTVAAETGLPPGVLLVSGMTDGCTSQIATGAVSRGDTVGILGTTLVLKAVAPAAITETAAGIYSHLAPDGNFWAGGASNTGAALLSADAGRGDRRRADALAAALPAAAVISYPLARPGERFPLSDPHFAGFLVDAGGHPVRKSTLSTNVRYRAVLEGVAFVERLALEKLAVWGTPGDGAMERGREQGRHHLSGGASASPIWNTIRASALGRTVYLPANTSSGFGAAVLAVIALTGETLADAVARLVPPPEAITPDPRLADQLDDGYRTFRTQVSAHSRG